MAKRVFDVMASSLGLVLLSPLFLIVTLLIRLDSRGPVFFRQERVGRQFRPFFMYKFRTMVRDAPLRGAPLTCGPDPRVTRIGRFLRKTKIDELPQLINVLKGDMSLVGPRPEVRPYVEIFREDYQDILSMRPGITDLASLKYPDEAEVLGRFVDPEQAYLKQVLPDKILLAREYLRQSSISFDFALIMKTLLKLAGIRVS